MENFKFDSVGLCQEGLQSSVSNQKQPLNNVIGYETVFMNTEMTNNAKSEYILEISMKVSKPVKYSDPLRILVTLHPTGICILQLG